MFYLEKEQCLRLNQLGFKPPYDEGEVFAYQFYYYNDEEWSVGGQITGADSILATEEIYKNGVRLYTIDEIFDWIHHEGLGMRLVKNINSGYKLIIFDEHGAEYKGSGGTLTNAVFKTTEKYLLSNPIQFSATQGF
ncbi:hypothetical protein [Brevibacillus fortis]|uniref:Uncharacterized protein n=1 Tax=Brevibacillus fortis TaxID=2126352 RepID=A0A2P7UIQ5_9BACL|nr:hypothetical protein [Brevibacillus fortis]PSJ86815.1 hypothetical protein C7R93_27855 [Brevibacillus fortis]